MIENIDGDTIDIQKEIEEHKVKLELVLKENQNLILSIQNLSKQNKDLQQKYDEIVQKSTIKPTTAAVKEPVSVVSSILSQSKIKPTTTTTTTTVKPLSSKPSITSTTSTTTTKTVASLKQVSSKPSIPQVSKPVKRSTSTTTTTTTTSPPPKKVNDKKPTLSKEEFIIEFIKNEPNLNDRLLLIECISKLSNVGLFIENVDSILLYIQELIIYKYDLDEETDRDYIAKWYFYVNDKNIAGTWKEYDLSTCKILERALKYGIDCVKINNKYFVDLQSYLQKGYNSDTSRIRVKRENARLQRDDGGALNNNTNNNNTDDNNLPFIPWYWKDDSLGGKNWIKYNDKLCIKFEKQFILFINNGKEHLVDIDHIKYVNVNTMIQARYDNTTRHRMVKRGEFKTPKVNLLLYDKISSKLFNPKLSSISPTECCSCFSSKIPIIKTTPLKIKSNYDETVSFIPTEELVQALTFDQVKFLLRKFKESQSFNQEETQQHSALFTHTLNTFRNVLRWNNSILLKNNYKKQ